MEHLKAESFKALIIPSFLHSYNKYKVDLVYKNALVRSIIKEFHLKQKHFMLFGPSSINLAAKSLE